MIQWNGSHRAGHSDRSCKVVVLSNREQDYYHSSSVYYIAPRHVHETALTGRESESCLR